MLGKKKKEAAKEEPALEGADGAAKPEGEAGAEGGEGAEGGAHGAAPKKSKKKLFIIVGAVLLLAGIGAGVYFSGLLGGKKTETASSAEPLGPDGKPIEKPIFYTLPDFLVNLNSQGKGASYLKTTIVLEMSHQADVPLLEANLPRVSDAFTTYLRELRPSDLAGSAGIQRLREELMLRVNRVITPVKVSDVLFKEVVVQ